MNTVIMVIVYLAALWALSQGKPSSIITRLD